MNINAVPPKPAQVEIVSTPLNGPERIARLIANYLIAVPLATLLVWWFFAAWFPQLGLTWWQLILPVVAYRALHVGLEPAHVKNVDESGKRR